MASSTAKIIQAMVKDILGPGVTVKAVIGRIVQCATGTGDFFKKLIDNAKIDRAARHEALMDNPDAQRELDNQKELAKLTGKAPEPSTSGGALSATQEPPKAATPKAGGGLGAVL